MGLTIGDVIEREGDLLGDGVNVAARLEALAPPGGICVSRSVHEQVANKLSVIFSDLGPQEVKNIPRPIHVYRVELEKGAAPAEVSTTLSVDGQSKEKQWRSALSPDGADVPLAHAWTRSFGKMGLIAACITFLAAACGVGWLWISSAQQPVTTLPLSEV